MFAKTFTATPLGVEGSLVEVETTLLGGTPAIQITGLPNSVIKESREKIRGVLESLGFQLPSRRCIIHLYPAVLKKEGSQFDLGITIAILAAEGFLAHARVARCGFLGELSLDGKVRPVVGGAALLETLSRCEEIETIIAPKDNEREASLLPCDNIFLAEDLSSIIRHLRGEEALGQPVPPSPLQDKKVPRVKFDQVEGQMLAKRGLTIAIAGRHHLLMSGPPGVGKSLLSQCIPGLLPELGAKEQVAVCKNFGWHGDGRPQVWQRPYRSPHHSATSVALLGGGTGIITPGEVTLAHYGVLFLDELGEFRRDALEGMREPLEAGEIHIHRQGKWINFPARFTLIAAMNPCPCGFSGSRLRRCRCTQDQLFSYRKKVSGPLMDRIDLLLQMGISKKGEPDGLSYDQAVTQIESAVRAQRLRFQDETIRNGDVATFDYPGFELNEPSLKWLEIQIHQSAMSHRVRHRLIRVARTIADMEQAVAIELEHLKEAWLLKNQSRHERAGGQPFSV